MPPVEFRVNKYCILELKPNPVIVILSKPRGEILVGADADEFQTV